MQFPLPRGRIRQSEMFLLTRSSVAAAASSTAVAEWAAGRIDRTVRIPGYSYGASPPVQAAHHLSTCSAVNRDQTEPGQTKVCRTPEGGEMAVVVGVHGIAQQNSTAVRQLRVWSDAFTRGVRRTQRSLDEDPTLAVPFYGWMFRKGSPYHLGDLGATAEDDWDDSEISFVAEALGEFTAGMPEDQLDDLERAAQTLGPPAIIPPPLLRGLAAIDLRWGIGRGLLLIGVLRQVNTYLFRPEAGDKIRQIVTDQFAGDTRVLVGHSLGSVIVYDLLRRGVAPQVSTLVTLGSPLPLATVRSALSAAEETSAAIERHVSWFNIHDPWDVVTGGLGLTPDAEDIKVTNRRSDPHALTEYLGRKEAAEVILSGATR